MYLAASDKLSWLFANEELGHSSQYTIIVLWCLCMYVCVCVRSQMGC